MVLEKILVDEDKAISPILRNQPRDMILSVPQKLLDRVTSLQESPGVMAIAHMPERGMPDLQKVHFAAIVFDLADPGNLGTIIRTADAAGMDAVFLAQSVDPFNPKVLRGSMGSVFHLPLLPFADTAELLDMLGSAGMRVAAADISGQISLYDADLTGPLALVVGAEARGLPPAFLDRADMTISIPMSARVESLNVSAAFAILAYEAYRQRSFPENA